MMRRRVVAVLCVVVIAGVSVVAQSAARVGDRTEYRVLATSRTSTMEKELNQHADTGFRFQAVMGGETAAGGNEVVVVMGRSGDTKGRYQYQLLATSKTSTMQKELNRAAEAGFDYRGQTVFDTLFGGKEVVVILERDREQPGPSHYTYELIATSRTSTLQKELQAVGQAGAEVLGMTVSETLLGGRELVAITRRPAR
jgi:hypothetical protein